jgi:hypothetical protein
LSPESPVSHRADVVTVDGNLQWSWFRLIARGISRDLSAPLRFTLRHLLHMLTPTGTAERRIATWTALSVSLAVWRLAPSQAGWAQPVYWSAAVVQLLRTSIWLSQRRETRRQALADTAAQKAAAAREREMAEMRAELDRANRRIDDFETAWSAVRPYEDARHRLAAAVPDGMLSSDDTVPLPRMRAVLRVIQGEG